MRRYLLLSLFCLSIPIALPAQAHLIEFEFKGLRLGMPVDELNDSLASTSFFLHGRPDAIVQHVGNRPERPDSLTSKLIFTGREISVGCVKSYRLEQCPIFEMVDIELKRGIVTAIRLQEKRTSSFWALAKILRAGLPDKIGPATEDHWDEWFGTPGDLRKASLYVVNSLLRWESAEGGDSAVVDLTFNLTDDGDVARNEKPLYNVSLSARLVKSELERWADAITTSSTPRNSRRQAKDDDGVEVDF